MSFKVVVKLKTKERLIAEGWIVKDNKLIKQLNWCTGDFWILPNMLRKQVELSIKDNNNKMRNLYDGKRVYSYPIEMMEEIISYEGNLPNFMKELIFKEEMDEIIAEGQINKE